MSNFEQFLTTIPVKEFVIDENGQYSPPYRKQLLKRIKKVGSQKSMESNQIASQIFKAIKFMSNNLDPIEATIASQ